MTLVESVLRSRVRAAGRITFAEFMETALYEPDAGYYTRPDRISARGDFYPSPTVHPAFGALICVQLREMWELLGRPRPFACVELGAASGVLAAGIQSYAHRLDKPFSRALRYTSVDRAMTTTGSPEEAASAPASRARGEGEGEVVGCGLSNELLE